MKDNFRVYLPYFRTKGSAFTDSALKNLEVTVFNMFESNPTTIEHRIYAPEITLRSK